MELTDKMVSREAERFGLTLVSVCSDNQDALFNLVDSTNSIQNEKPMTLSECADFLGWGWKEEFGLMPINDTVPDDI